MYKLEKDTGELVEVAPERWCWEAHYINGEILRQFDPATGKFHQFKEIDQKRLYLFKMVSESGQEYSLIFDSSTMKLVHFYRRVVLEALTSRQQKMTYYCFGYEQKVFNKNVLTLLIIAPDDKLFVTNTKDFKVIYNTM
jgi:hypothetical protein